MPQGQSEFRPGHFDPEGGSREECGGDSSGPKVTIPYQWRELLDSELSPVDFDAVLSGVLRSTAEMDEVKGLNGGERQLVIDVLAQYLETRNVMNGLGKKCLKLLCDVCAVGEVLPTLYTLNPSDLQREEEPECVGGFSAIWRGSYNGAAVAIKRLYISQPDIKKERLCCDVIMWKRITNPNILPFLGAYVRGSEIVMVSPWMDNGNTTQYLRENPRANRLPLLTDVARGVVYLHSINIVHGNLKGLNILVKDDGSACLAGFSLMSIVPDPESADIITSSGGRAGGTYRWMSPELFNPNEFGLSKVQYTKESDCYALGMVIYEVLMGKFPFEEIKPSFLVPTKVLEGTRPSIPDHISPMTEPWNLVRECWSHYPQDRPTSSTIRDRLDALARMKDVTPLALPGPRPMQGKVETTTELQALLTVETSEGPLLVNATPSSRSKPYQWQDLLKPDLPPTGFDAVLSGVLRSTTEMGKIKGLNKGELQRVIDVLGQCMENRDVMDGLRKRCFGLLCGICATRGVLPTLYTVNPNDLQRSEQASDGGGFGTVWKGEYNGVAVAVKTLNSLAQPEARKKIFCREVIMWKRLSSPYTLPFLGAHMHDLELMMVSPWMENGNIKKYLEKNPHVNRLPLLVDVAQGVVYLHDMGVVHGDLKGLNILVKDDGRACLADFGFMSIAPDPGTTDLITSWGGKAKGTYPWMSPELLDPSQFGQCEVRLTTQSDCYALGMVVYEVLSGKIPFEELKQSWKVANAIVTKERPSIPEHVSRKMMGPWNLAQECWRHNPQDRPSSRTILHRLDTFARMEGIPPFVLPRIQTNADASNVVVIQTYSSSNMTTIPLQTLASASAGGFGLGVGARFKRALHVVRATTKLSKLRLR